MRARLSILLGLVLVAAAVAGAEQAHEAPPKATSPAHDAPEAKNAAAASDTKSTEQASPPKKKVPTVSRLAPPAASSTTGVALATAAEAPPPAEHGPVTGAHPPAKVAPAAAPPTGSHGGYVATGSRSKAGAAPVAAKAKPLVSGTPAGTTPKENAHGGAAPVSEDAGPAPTPPPRPAPRGLARLSDVHERIAAALASLKEDTGRTGGHAAADAEAGRDSYGSPPPPRIRLRWPAPRWRVVWATTVPQGRASRQVTSAPAPSGPALHATPAGALPAPSPVSAQPPDRH